MQTEKKKVKPKIQPQQQHRLPVWSHFPFPKKKTTFTNLVQSQDPITSKVGNHSATRWPMACHGMHPSIWNTGRWLQTGVVEGVAEGPRHKKTWYNLLAGTYRKSLRIGKKINLANWQTSIFGFRVSFGGRMCLLLGGVHTLLQT